MPLVNIVDIDNLESESGSKSLRTFYIASAITSDEKIPSYLWILQMLRELVYTEDSKTKPGLFVSDDDHALRSALKTVYLDVPAYCAGGMSRGTLMQELKRCFQKLPKSMKIWWMK